MFLQRRFDLQVLNCVLSLALTRDCIKTIARYRENGKMQLDMAGVWILKPSVLVTWLFAKSNTALVSTLSYKVGLSAGNCWFRLRMQMNKFHFPRYICIGSRALSLLMCRILPSGFGAGHVGAFQRLEKAGVLCGNEVSVSCGCNMATQQ